MAVVREGVWTLPDGRRIRVVLTGPGGPDHGGDSGWWSIAFVDDPADWILGSPLPSTLASLLGYEIMDGWPEWIDHLSTEIETALRDD